MRRTPLRRKTSLRSGRPPRRKEELKKCNPERIAKRRKAYRDYLRSAEWREKKRLIHNRSGGRCERVRPVQSPEMQERGIRPLRYRCTNKAAVVNHKTYARFRHELLEDLEHLCESCNREHESEKRPWNRGRRYA